MNNRQLLFHHQSRHSDRWRVGKCKIGKKFLSEIEATDRLSQNAKTGSATFFCAIICWKTGCVPRTAISGKAIPKMPSNFAMIKTNPGSLKRMAEHIKQARARHLVASANSCTRTQIPATHTVSSKCIKKKIAKYVEKANRLPLR